jgi:3-deoxy-manno-octulosonate cytidylyltransferase (CMP-KDO synthetase)
MASTRLPGKPLADIAGLPMIVHVQRRAAAAGIGEAIVATDSEAVAAAIEKHGGRAIMTRSDHVSGSDRIYEALAALDPERRIDIVVNVQGDLPTIEPSDIRASLGPLTDPHVDIATLAAEIENDEDWTNPNIVKVVGIPLEPERFKARMFARSLLPETGKLQKRTKGRDFTPAQGQIDAFSHSKFYHHIGLYAYRRAALERFVTLPPSANEQRERLEQMRALDAGMRIDVALVKGVPLGVDTPEELEKARTLLGG